jgi:membrane protein
LSEDRIAAIAAGATFYVLLALVPAIASLISLYGLFADSSSIARHLDLLAGVLPEGGVQIIGEQIERLTAQPAPTLGLATIGTLAVSIWSANAGVKAIFDALNVVYREKEKRGFIKLNAISLTLTFCALLFCIISLTAIAVAPVVLSYLGLSDAAGTLIGLARWPLLFAIAVLFAAIFYRFGPSRDQAKWRWITPGSVLAVLIWLAMSVLFSWYAANFGTYNRTYGSLGAVIGFMTWLWISIMVVLLGGKLNAEMEHQTARDTTEGRPQPIGARGAYVADNVAPGDQP